jgi:putative tricarboxylic transport membrane protein
MTMAPSLATTPARDVPGDVRRRKIDFRSRAAPLVLLLLGVTAAIGSWQLSLGDLASPKPGLWPFIVSMAVVVTAAIMVAAPDASPRESWTVRTAGIAGGAASLGLFIVLFETVGFLIPATLMLAFWLKVFGREPWLLTAPLAVAGAAVFYIIFAELLGVPFPDDIVLSAFYSTGF